MPTIVIKTARDRDQYIGWSTIVEAPVWLGDRKEMAECIADDFQRSHSGCGYPTGHTPADRLARADETGTSAAGDYSWFGAWDHHGLIYMQRGILPRGDLAKAADWWIEQDSLDADLPSSFMVAFDDEDEVRPVVGDGPESLPY